MLKQLFLWLETIARQYNKPGPLTKPAIPEPQTPEDIAKLKDEIISRELADVILLLDYLSGRDDRSIATLSLGLDHKDLVQAVFEAHWPPTTAATDAQIAAAASTMFKARDQLNEIAYPATGASIAFTILTTGEDQVHDTTAGTRRSLAAWAHPQFMAAADSFARFRSKIFWCLAFFIVLTSLLSWHVAVGQFYVNSIATNDEKLAALLSDLRRNTSETVFEADVPCNAADTVQTDTAPKTPGATGSTPRPAGDSTSALRTCVQIKGLHVARCNASFALSLWYAHQPWSWLNPFLSGGQPPQGSPAATLQKCTATPPLQPFSDPIEQTSAAVIQTESTAILPMCYGLLGAMAAICLSIYRKTKNSTLMPRDRAQMATQSLLGIVIGGCIGLFLTPATAISALGGVASSVSLSSSGLSFLAGLGVERVFRWLETIIAAVFGGATPDADPLLRQRILAQTRSAAPPATNPPSPAEPGTPNAPPPTA